jgi:hypothetical protein
MSSREGFEKVAIEYGMTIGRHLSGNYLWSDTDVAWSFWQAAERQALERAAQECDALESKFAKLEPVDGSYLNACDDCAERIRALIDAQSG